MINEIIRQVPQWANAKEVAVAPIDGLTNSNYLVTVDGERFVARIARKNSALLGINRIEELATLQAAAALGIGAEVVHYRLPEGHLITRFIAGQHWTPEEYQKPESLRRIVETVKRLHTSTPVTATFSPFRRVESFANTAQLHGVPFPPDYADFMARMRDIEVNQQADPSPWLGFCHNDLFGVNFLDDGNIRIIDWEFAGMGDIYYDLATLVYAYDSFGPLPPELEEYLLECYFGKVNHSHRLRLAQMKFMALLFTAMWGLLQQAMLLGRIIDKVEWFDFLEYAEGTFTSIRQLQP